MHMNITGKQSRRYIAIPPITAQQMSETLRMLNIGSECSGFLVVKRMFKPFVEPVAFVLSAWCSICCFLLYVIIGLFLYRY